MSFLLEEVRNLGRRFYFYKYRSLMRRNEILIDRNSIILASTGIKIGSGTRIYPYAKIAATCLGWDDSLTSIPSGSIRLGRNCMVHGGAIIASYGGTVEIGNDVSINPGTILYGHGGLKVGDNTRIAANTVIIPANHIFENKDIPIKDQGLTCQGISIGSDVWIGTGVTVLDGVSIGDGAVLGAGCVVTRDVKSGEVVAGVPAKAINLRYKTAAQNS